jgi:FixJ family two-component response regulator
VAAEHTIGVIDDDPSLRTALLRLMRSLGYDACGFGSAQDFLGSTSVEDCSCIVTDIQMPGMDGLDLMKAVAQRRPDLPVIVITARSEPDLEDRAIAQGAICFLRKPLDSDALVRGLDRALNI